MSDPLDAVFVTGDEAAELKRTNTARKLAMYLERMTAELRSMFTEEFQHINRAELAQLRADLQAAQDAEKHWQEMAQAELDTANRLRAKEERLDQLQEGVSEMRAAIETEFDSTIETQKNNIKQLIELIERQFDDITALRADLRAAQERSAEQARQLEEARDTMIAVMPHLPISGDGYNTRHPARISIDAWLAANPAPEAEPQPPNGEGRP